MIALGKQSEIDTIIALTKACGKHLRANGIDQWDENYPDRESISRDLATETLFTFRDNDEIIGIVVLNESQDEEYNEIDWLTSNESKNLVVHRLAVLPDHQGKGIARKLMDHAEAYAKKNDYDSIRLDTFSQNPRNQKFYSTRGYSDLGPVYLKYKKDHPYYCYELLLK
ncbi:MAG: ribosomal protein S18 acetylase RimI-like enzyme [Flavobacteriaceae bacterium]|jgi:ribosomal protein S18 acetylase RimI-like enzyme